MTLELLWDQVILTTEVSGVCPKSQLSGDLTSECPCIVCVPTTKSSGILRVHKDILIFDSIDRRKALLTR